MAAPQHQRLIVGSRQSALAMWQTRHIVEKLRRAWPGLEVDVRTYVTEGDRNLLSALPEIGGKGVFTAQLEQALAAREIDLAVHSLKDLPVESDAAFVIGAITSRTEVRDVVVAREGWTLATLPRGAVVGTSSLRRQAQVLALRPDLVIKAIRGNVETRVRKVMEGEYAAAVLAAAGVSRLGLEGHVTEWIAADTMVPAPGQGALAVQCRAGDEATLRLLARIDESDARTAVTAERLFLQQLGGGCSAPIAAHAVVQAGRVRMIGLVGSPDGTRVIRVEDEAGDGAALAGRLAARALAQGAREILGSFRAASTAGPRPGALAGRRVVVTRPREQASELCRRLAELGAVPICAPAIRIEPVDDPAPLDAAIRDADAFDWIIFTSASAVAVFRERWTCVGRAATDLRAKVAAIGSATARALEDWGVHPDFVPGEFVGEALARDLPVAAGARVLFPRAEIAPPEAVEILTGRGARVVDLPVYRTRPETIAPEVLDDIRRGVDAVIFTSESTVRHFMDAVRSQAPGPAFAEQTRIACIGPVTAGAARELGLRVDAVASTHTTAGLLDTLAEAFSKGGVGHDS
jgi:hydroxymethylbilane synthase